MNVFCSCPLIAALAQGRQKVTNKQSCCVVVAQLRQDIESNECKEDGQCTEQSLIIRKAPVVEIATHAYSRHQETGLLDENEHPITKAATPVVPNLVEKQQERHTLLTSYWLILPLSRFRKSKQHNCDGLPEVTPMRYNHCPEHELQRINPTSAI